MLKSVCKRLEPESTLYFCLGLGQAYSNFALACAPCRAAFTSDKIRTAFLVCSWHNEHEWSRFERSQLKRHPFQPLNLHEGRMHTVLHKNRALNQVVNIFIFFIIVYYDLCVCVTNSRLCNSKCGSFICDKQRCLLLHNLFRFYGLHSSRW